jgi:DHA2 family multidrug resistance protein
MIAPYPDPTTRSLITGSTMVATIMVMLDTTIASIALPQMQSSLQASQEQIVWVLTSYLIAAAIATLASGWLAERFGRKRIMLISTAGFTIASIGCGIATSLDELVLFRLLQGVFGASLVPLSQAILLDINPPERHGPAMALYGLGSMVGPLLGPTFGGWLTEAMSWRWIFFINIPFGVIAFLGMSAFMTEHRRPDTGRFDLMGFAALAISIGALQLMLDRGQLLDWFSSWEICIEAGVVVLFAYVTIVHMFTTREPFVRPALFTDRNFLTGLLVSTLMGVFTFAAIPLLTNMMQQLLGYSAMLTGWVSVPRGIGTVFAMVVVGRLIAKVDPRLLLIVGLAISAVGLHMYAQMALSMDKWTIIFAGFVQGFGGGLLFVPLTFVVFSTLDSRYRNEGAALYALTRNLGSSIGISLLQLITIHNAAAVQSRLVEGVRPDNPVLDMRVPDFDFQMPSAVSGMMHEIGRQALMVAYIDAFWMLFLLSLAMIPICLLMRPVKNTARGEPLPIVE